MSKEDILKAAQKEKRGNEVEQHAVKRGVAWAFVITLLFGLIMNGICYINNKTADIGVTAMMFIALACEHLIEGKKSHSKKLLLLGIVFAVLAFIFFVGYIGKQVNL